MQVNDLSKKLKPAPLTKPAEYRLLAAGRIDQRQNPKAMCPSIQSLRGQEFIYDPGDKAGEGRQKTLRYVSGTPRASAANPAILEYDIDHIDFPEGGLLVVQPHETAKYEFLERSNYNASNPYRLATALPVFERLDHVAKAEAQNTAEEILDGAVEIFRALSAEAVLDFAAAKQLATPDQDYVLVKRAVRNYVNAHPQKFKDEIDSPETKVKALIAQALANRVLQYDPTEGVYKWVEQGVVLYQVPQGFDGPQALFKYLMEAGAVPAAQLKELEKQVKTATGAK